MSNAFLSRKVCHSYPDHSNKFSVLKYSSGNLEVSNEHITWMNQYCQKKLTGFGKIFGAALAVAAILISGGTAATTLKIFGYKVKAMVIAGLGGAVIGGATANALQGDKQAPVIRGTTGAHGGEVMIADDGSEIPIVTILKDTE